MTAPMTAKPPTTPPAIAPVGVDLLDGAGVADVVVGPGVTVMVEGPTGMVLEGVLEDEVEVFEIIF
jgi:hypothetical protein